MPLVLPEIVRVCHCFAYPMLKSGGHERGALTVLTVVVSHHELGDWALALKVDGQQKHETKTISAETCPDGWLPVEFDLSDWAGKTICVELLNQATGWKYEAGYWDEIKIESK